MYDPERLLDYVTIKMQLKNDAALSRALQINPSNLTRIRQWQRPISASLMVHIHEMTGMSIRYLRDLMGDRRSKYRSSDTLWTEEQRAIKLGRAESWQTTQVSMGWTSAA